MGTFRLAAFLSLAIFFGEMAIMFMLDYAPIENQFLKNGADAAALVVIVFPFLYFLVFRPVFKKNRELQATKQLLLDARERLEERIRERTADVEEANRQLAQSVQQLNFRQREMVLLGEMGNFFQACRDLGEAMPVAETHLRRLFPDLSGALFLMNSSRDTLERTASWGRPVAMEAFHAPGDCWALRRGKPHVVTPMDRAIACRHNRSVETLGHICLPLSANGDALGTLCLQAELSPTDGSASGGMPDAQMEFYVAAAESLALAIANLRLRETLRFQALRDPLTGLFNRRYLLETLDCALTRATDRNLPLSVAMLDVDHFKRFNDAFGHAAGDAVLARLGVLLREWAQGGEMVARYGGEEFTVVLPEASTAAASVRLESLRQEIETLVVQHGGQALARVTISAGIATYPLHALDRDGLIRAADQALYGAKQSGRNRVNVARDTAGLQQMLEASRPGDSSETLQAALPTANVA